MTDARHVTWTNLDKLLIGDVPVRLPVEGTPPLHLLIEANGASLCLLIPWSDQGSAPVSPLTEIQVSVRVIDGQRFLSLGASQRRLFQECFAFFLQVADEIQLRQKTPVQAFQESLASWRDMMREIPILSVEEQIGLCGELWAASRFIQTKGLSALDGWIGPLKENHDFRFDGLDLEVKTTSQQERIHFIADLSQLVPSHGHRLFLLSLQVQPTGSGGGASLADAVDSVRLRLRNDSVRLAQFESHLRLLAYDDKHRVHYSRRFKLRSSAALIPVDTSFPAITSPVINEVLGAVRAARIKRVQYQVDVYGLGVSDGTPGFLQVLPACPEGNLF